MKKFYFNKKIISTIITNFAIVFAIFSVFGICFWTDSTAVVSSSGYKAIYKGNENKNNVSLCINVYWGTEYVLDMLNILDEANAKATFFVGGTWASQNVDVLREIYSRGHEIANHGYYHNTHSFLHLCHFQSRLSILNNLHRKVHNMCQFPLGNNSQSHLLGFSCCHSI